MHDTNIIHPPDIHQTPHEPHYTGCQFPLPRYRSCSLRSRTFAPLPYGTAALISCFLHQNPFKMRQDASGTLSNVFKMLPSAWNTFKSPSKPYKILQNPSKCFKLLQNPSKSVKIPCKSLGKPSKSLQNPLKLIKIHSKGLQTLPKTFKSHQRTSTPFKIVQNTSQSFVSSSFSLKTLQNP